MLDVPLAIVIVVILIGVFFAVRVASKRMKE